MTFGGSCGGRAAVCGGSDRRTRNHMNDNGKSQLRRLSCGGCGGLSQVLDIIRCGGCAADAAVDPPYPPIALSRAFGAPQRRFPGGFLPVGLPLSRLARCTLWLGLGSTCRSASTSLAGRSLTGSPMRIDRFDDLADRSARLAAAPLDDLNAH